MIILGSSSPRRREIFENNLDLKFDVVVSGFPEDISKGDCSTSDDYVERTCLGKMEAIASSIDREFDVLVCADTVISLDDAEVSVLEKPNNHEEAFEMLSRLSNGTHKVKTAVAFTIKNKDGGKMEKFSFVESTEVTFDDLSRDVIDAYIKTSEPFDKAGGYGL